MLQDARIFIDLLEMCKSFRESTKSKKKTYVLHYSIDIYHYVATFWLIKKMFFTATFVFFFSFFIFNLYGREDKSLGRLRQCLENKMI